MPKPNLANIWLEIEEIKFTGYFAENFYFLKSVKKIGGVLSQNKLFCNNISKITIFVP
jgi:hypothetical protein